MDYSAEIERGMAANTSRMPEHFPHPFDRWLASSAWQKSIRRGEVDCALLMTRAFLTHEPSYIWKRIVIIALEDIGLANLPLVNQILFVSGKQAWIQRIGEAALAEYLVTALCESVKDRNACELVQVADKHPDYHPHRQQYPRLPCDELAAIALGDDWYAAILAIWCMFGTRKFPSEHFTAEGFARERVLEILQPEPQLRDLFQLAWSKPAYGIPLGCLALHPWLRRQTTTVVTETPPPTPWEGIYPLYALDMYTRAGKRALMQWAEASPVLHDFLSRHLPRREWGRYLGNLVFVLESQNVNLRLRYAGCDQPVWKTAEAELVTETFPKPLLEELTTLMQDDFSSLHEARSACLRG